MVYEYNLGRAFERVGATHPERPALVFGAGHSLCYGELDRMANRLAGWLTARGLRRRDVVGLFNSKSPRGFALMLAALKIGAAYVNLDEQNPPQRLGRILQSCVPRLVVSDRALAPDVLQCCEEVAVPVALLPEGGALDALPAERLQEFDDVTGTDPAYLMFTSGSTGTPKGVVISHASVLNFIGWARDEFGITSRDVLTNVNPVYFDNSVFDFYASLFSGAALAPLPREVVASPADLVRRVGELGCTVWFSVPSLLIYLMTMRQMRGGIWPAMRCVVFGGEGYPKGELKKLFDVFHPGARLVNVYGPTECTCICSAHTITESDFAVRHGLPTLGRLAPNFGFLVLSDDQQKIMPGEVGELCLLGPQVGMGYYNDPVRTAEGFVLNPLCGPFSERMYRTGDLVRRDQDGMLWFVGRRDNQIKHMGYRIELEEIEAALNALPHVTQAAAVYQRIREQHGRIVAFVASSAPISESSVKDGLKDSLPDYMIPGQVQVLPELPKNANGKVDRKALAAGLSV